MEIPKKTPPRLARWLLLRFLREDLAEEVLGDLDEKFYLGLKTKSVFRVKLNYWYQVIHYLRPFAIQKSKAYYFNHFDMLKSNFKVAVRSLWKHKSFSFINLFGLTIGLSSCLLISVYIQHEYSYDTFQLNGERTARIIMEYSFSGNAATQKGNFTSTKVAPVFSRTFPEVEAGVRMTSRKMIVRHQDNFVSEPNFIFADSSFFDVFTYTMVRGNPKKALNGSYKVVLTKSMARKYFGNEDPLGNTLLIGVDEQPYEITGIIEDYPSNSQIKFDFLASFSSLGVNQEVSYWDANYTTYLLLKDKQAFASLQDKISPFMKKEMEGTNSYVNFILEPFNTIHLYSEYSAFVPNTSITYLYILSAVALLILVIVCFTYINLTTARSIEKAKEVGVRKVVGAARGQLFWQFIGESALLCVASVLLSIAVVIFILPYFNQLTENQLQLRELLSPFFISFSLIITLAVSLLAGFYPALILAGFQPVKVLKGSFKNTDSGKWVQQSLIIFQFVISVFLIVSTLVIQKQLYFIQHRNLGYNRDHVLLLPIQNKMLQTLATIKQEFQTNPRVLGVTRCVSTPVIIGGGYAMRSATMDENEYLSVTGNPVDEDYIKATGLQLIAGDNFTEQDVKDVSLEDISKRVHHFILNESAAKELGWTPEEAIGKKMFLGDHRPGFVKGVIKDFHFQSMHEVIKPLVLFTEVRGHGQLMVKINGQDIPNTISFIEAKWKQLVPYIPFEYRFLDDDYDRLYKSELKLGTVMNIFSGIAIILACIGLFGLSSYIVQQRMKEISIRKILGATLFDIAGKLSGNFARLVIIAILIALPLSYLLMSNWLKGFAYRIGMQWWVFGAAGITIIVIALLTVSFQCIKAAVTNPIKNLRSE